jgi:hypothetical protein
MNWIFKLRPLTGKFFRRSIISLFVSSLFLTTNLFAALQFDVFLGYDGLVPQAAWVPVVCELKNDGPTFTGIVEVSPGSFAGGQPRRMIVELPTGSLKRITIPVFFVGSIHDELGRATAERKRKSSRRTSECAPAAIDFA